MKVWQKNPMAQVNGVEEEYVSNPTISLNDWEVAQDRQNRVKNILKT